MRKSICPCQFLQLNPGKWTAIIACLVFLVSLFQANPIQAQSSTRAVISPGTSTISVGNSVTVNLNLMDGVDINAFDVEISYDPTIVSLDSWSTGGYLSNLAKVYETNVPGSLRLVFTQLATAGANGSGTLLSFTFIGQAAGTSPVSISSIQLSNTSAESVPVSASGGEIIVEAPVVRTSTGTPTSTQTAPAQATHTVTPTQTFVPTHTHTVTPTRVNTYVPIRTRTPTAVHTSAASSQTPWMTSTLTKTPVPSLTAQPTGTPSAALTLVNTPGGESATSAPAEITITATSTEEVKATSTTSLKTAVSPIWIKILPEDTGWKSQLPCALSLFLLIILILLVVMILSQKKKNKKS